MEGEGTAGLLKVGLAKGRISEALKAEEFRMIERAKDDKDRRRRVDAINAFGRD